jgi:ABC-type multidrug transport system permease subunit
LPEKGGSRNFVIEWLVVFIFFMAMASLATVVALRWFAGASIRLTTAAT